MAGGWCAASCRSRHVTHQQKQSKGHRAAALSFVVLVLSTTLVCGSAAGVPATARRILEQPVAPAPTGSGPAQVSNTAGDTVDGVRSDSPGNATSGPSNLCACASQGLASAACSAAASVYCNGQASITQPCSDWEAALRQDLVPATRVAAFLARTCFPGTRFSDGRLCTCFMNPTSYLCTLAILYKCKWNSYLCPSLLLGGGGAVATGPSLGFVHDKVAECVHIATNTSQNALTVTMNFTGVSVAEFRSKYAAGCIASLSNIMNVPSAEITALSVPWIDNQPRAAANDTANEAGEPGAGGADGRRRLLQVAAPAAPGAPGSGGAPVSRTTAVFVVNTTSPEARLGAAAALTNAAAGDGEALYSELASNGVQQQPSVELGGVMLLAGNPPQPPPATVAAVVPVVQGDDDASRPPAAAATPASPANASGVAALAAAPAASEPSSTGTSTAAAEGGSGGSGQLAVETIIGIVVGCVAVLALLLALLLWRRKKSAAAKRGAAAPASTIPNPHRHPDMPLRVVAGLSANSGAPGTDAGRAPNGRDQYDEHGGAQLGAIGAGTTGVAPPPAAAARTKPEPPASPLPGVAPLPAAATVYAPQHDVAGGGPVGGSEGGAQQAASAAPGMPAITGSQEEVRRAQRRHFWSQFAGTADDADQE